MNPIKIFFLISVAIAFYLLIKHSNHYYGKKFTQDFFVGGFIFSILRETIYYNLLHKYGDDPLDGFNNLNVYLVIPTGWVFTFYLSYYFADSIFEGKYRKKYDTHLFCIFAMFFATAICLAIETAAIHIGLWDIKTNKIGRWSEVDGEMVMEGDLAPAALLGGWGYTIFCFIYLFLIYQKKIPIKKIVIPLYTFYWVFLIENFWLNVDEVTILFIIGIAMAIHTIILDYRIVLSLIGIMILTQLFPFIFESIPNSYLILIAFIYEFFLIVLFI